MAGASRGAASSSLFNLLLACGTRSLLERLLSKRKVRELLVFLIFMLWMLPRFLFVTGHRPRLAGTLDATRSSTQRGRGPPPPGPRWASPSSLALLSLAGWTLLAGWFGRTQFERNLRFDAVAAQATPQTSGASALQSLAEAFYRFPSRSFAIRWRRSSKRNCARCPARRATAWSS